VSNETGPVALALLKARLIMRESAKLLSAANAAAAGPTDTSAPTATTTTAARLTKAPSILGLSPSESGPAVARALASSAADPFRPLLSVNVLAGAVENPALVLTSRLLNTLPKDLAELGGGEAKGPEAKAKGLPNMFFGLNVKDRAGGSLRESARDLIAMAHTGPEPGSVEPAAELPVSVAAVGPGVTRVGWGLYTPELRMEGLSSLQLPELVRTLDPPRAPPLSKLIVIAPPLPSPLLLLPLCPVPCSLGASIRPPRSAVLQRPLSPVGRRRSGQLPRVF
jgi:hypothetical protein